MVVATVKQAHNTSQGWLKLNEESLEGQTVDSRAIDARFQRAGVKNMASVRLGGGGIFPRPRSRNFVLCLARNYLVEGHGSKRNIIKNIFPYVFGGYGKS